MTNMNEVDLDQGKVNVEVFNQTDAALATLSNKYSELPDVNTSDGYEFVKNGLNEVVKYRTTLDKERKRIKEPYLNAGRIIDKEAKRITEALVKIEGPLQAAKKEVDDREKREKEERLARLRAKVDAIANTVQRARNQPSSVIADLIEEVDAIDTANDFYDLTHEATEVQARVVSELGDMYSQALRLEQAEEDRRRMEEQRKAEEEARQITDRINAIRMAPANAIGQPADEIEQRLKSLQEINMQGFGDRSEEAYEAASDACDQMQKMLEHQRRIDAMEAEAEKPLTEDHEDPDTESLEEPSAEAPEESGGSGVWMSDDGVRAEGDDTTATMSERQQCLVLVADFCDRHGLSLEASEELESIVKPYLR